MTLWRTVAKLWCHKLCAVFGPPCSYENDHKKTLLEL